MTRPLVDTLAGVLPALLRPPQAAPQALVALVLIGCPVTLTSWLCTHDLGQPSRPPPLPGQLVQPSRTGAASHFRSGVRVLVSAAREEGVVGGRRAELEAFCAAAYPRLVGALALHCGDRYLAEDLAQEALIRACRHWGRVRLMQSPVGWAYRVGVNLSTSQSRRRSAEDRALTRAADSSRHAQDSTDREAAMDITAALGLLPDNHRSVVLLRYQLGLTAVEAAEVLGTTPAAVRQLSVRALKGLRAHVEFDADDLEPESRHVT